MANEQNNQQNSTSELVVRREKLAGLVTKIFATSGADGRFYGSVTSKEIAEELEKQHGVSVDKRKILLNDTIKAFGTYSIDVKLHPEVTGKLNVVVTAKD